MSRIDFLKLIDDLILPLTILIGAKYVGIFISTLFSPISMSFGVKSELPSTPFVYFSNSTQAIGANSLSWLSLDLVVVVVFGYVLFRTVHFNVDRIKPSDLTKIHIKNLDFLIVPNQDAYYQQLALALLSISFIILSTVDFLFGFLNPCVFGLTLAIGIGMIVSLTGFMRFESIEGENRERKLSR